MFQTLAAIASLKSRGHAVLVYQQADDGYDCYLGSARLQHLDSCANIVDGMRWRAIQYQHELGVPAFTKTGNFIGPQTVPEHIKHRQPGEHNKLNEFLVKYINDHRIL